MASLAQGLEYYVYRIVWKTTSHYIHITRTETRIIQEVVLYLRSHYIVLCQSKTNILSNARSFLHGLMLLSGTKQCLNRRSYIIVSYIANSATSILKSIEFGEIHGQNISHYIRGRTILKVALYKNSDAIFSHYIRGRIVLKVALFSRLYGMQNFVRNLNMCTF